MAAISIVTGICAVGVAFYLRFLIALWKESRHAWICYLVRLDPEAGANPVVPLLKKEKSLARAA